MSAPVEPASDPQLRPRDAATLIIVDTTSGEPRILMGRRHEAHVFMPGKYVFPGGRVERTDRLAPSADEPPQSEISKLLVDMRGQPSPARARGLALAAIRETFEEAGLIIGGPAVTATVEPPETWAEFLAHGHLPRPGALRFFARAITPPGRPRRFDSRFFYVDAAAISRQVPAPTDELQSLDWFGPEQIRSLDLPAITRVVVEDLMDRLASGLAQDNDAPVPFYTNRNGTFRRELIRPVPHTAT
jgi:8-oxo-dGTP pyrophosphatase MutT (NUDIX family)